MNKPNYKLAKLQQDFKFFYDANLRRKYEQLEPARQKYLGEFKTRFAISAAIVLIVIFLCMRGIICQQIYSSDWFIKLSVMVVIGMVYICSLPFKYYRADTKSLVMDKILSFWGTFKYSVVSTIDDEDIKDSELFPHYNKDKTDDSFSGITILAFAFRKKICWLRATKMITAFSEACLFCWNLTSNSAAKPW